MQFQKRLIKVVAMFLCALTITFSITSSLTINSYAAVITASASAELTLTKVIDMALTKTGVIANNNWLQKVQASFLNMMNGTASSYSSYCEANGLEKNEETWAQYLSSDAYIGLGFAIPNYVLQSVWAIEWMLAPEQYAEEQKQMQAAVQALAETATCVQGETYKLKDEAVEFVRDTFDNLVASEGIGYFYLNTYTSDYLDLDWYNTQESYNNAKQFIDDNYLTMCVYNYYPDTNSYYDKYKTHRYIVLHESCLIYGFVSNGYVALYPYDSSWNQLSARELAIHSHPHDIEFNSYDTFFGLSNEKTSMELNYTYQGASYGGDCIFFTKDGRKILVYSSLDSLKQYNGGNKPVYQVTNYNYSTTNDNSINFTGDYIVNNGIQYSYEIVQNTIDQSQSNTDASVSTSVNDSYNTIINNYYYTTPDSGGDGNGDGGDSGGGLGSLLDGIGSLLNFVVTLIGDVLSLIGSFLDTVYDMIKNLGGSFTNFSGLMGELFTFIPQDLMDLIEAGIGVAIVIVIWKMFRS